jgi:proline racemase
MEMKQMFTSVDTNTEGGPTRIVTSGVPRLKGASVGEKRDYFKARYDSVRDGLLNHPRGYPGMFGAILTEPSHPDADIGVFFMTNTNYLNMCVHSAIGVAAVCIETGMVPHSEEETSVKLDTPAGLIKLKAEYRDNKLNRISIKPGPAFVHTPLIDLALGDGSSISACLIFSAVLFIMIDVKPLDLHVDKGHEKHLQSLAIKAIETANMKMATASAEKEAPCLVDLAFIYEDTGDNSCISAVYSKAGVLDQSPCGAGTAAKVVMACQTGNFQPEHIYKNINLFGKKFEGRAIKNMKSCNTEGVYTEISGSAQITGFHQFIIE